MSIVSDLKLVEILWVLLACFITFILWRMNFQRVEEPFETSSDISEAIIRIYYDNLHRAPNSKELRTHTDNILKGEYDYKELELRIINSDEYQRLIKTQTNSILPETTRMIEERDLIEFIKRVYKKVRARDAPKELLLPLKDLYIYFQYDLYKLVAMLRDTKYPGFEEELLANTKLSRDTLIELYLKTFDDSKLNYDAEAIRKMDESLGKGKRMKDLINAEPGAPLTDQGSINTAALLAFLLQNAQNIQDKDKAAKKLESTEKIDEKKLEDQRKMLVTSTSDMCTASQRVYLPNESKILKSDYGFQVLHKFPPVCIPVGSKNKVSEPILYSKLQGTPLTEANDTQVGSIMPKFEYREYIELPVPGTTKKPKA